MLKSMTAYGRATVSSETGSFVAEIQSLNRKFKEVFVQLPRELTSLETDIRKWVGERVFRGKITLRISASYEGSSPVTVTPNLPLARQLKSAWEKVIQDLELSGAQELSLPMLANETGILLYHEDFDEEEYKKILCQAVGQALDNLIAMKLREGESLEKDFAQRVDKLKAALEDINSLRQGSVDRYKDKLRQKLEEVLPGVAENEERLLREVCVYADKVDISEEVTRMKSHIEQFSEIVDANRDEKGKTLEFILQEMHREVNTMGAKSDDVGITRHVVAMKTEIEKLREQVQNVE